ncbi:hypothetical protein ACFQFC_08010 [Amorphoplanes digitatis]|uniref:Uncharacterized protein n=1 Tax=Actinoplanes digitatis TaxID=1868 RepID=A0A7W7I0K5_9ACTN|nr:hypothetical protein [Actinoplanes digitatis]MBB4764147.1 hypothetical protein [Actinoplanes digitatis]BFE73501.1 hypothetical protein GCM10020092_068020 [Actinoplanes digitatis]GID97536.1 hypothetical protein Adi01nite_69480 [Actinoplanes digitatis]
MSADLDEALLRELAEPLVAEFSPAEQGDLFLLLSDAYFADPSGFSRRDRDKALGPLAFGLPELTVLLTPVLLAATNETVRYLVESAAERGTKVTAAALRRLFKRGAAAEVTPGPELVLTAEQWSHVRQIVERVALKGGVPADQAELIADAVAGQGLTQDGT